MENILFNVELIEILDDSQLQFQKEQVQASLKLQQKINIKGDNVTHLMNQNIFLE